MWAAFMFPADTLPRRWRSIASAHEPKETEGNPRNTKTMPRRFAKTSAPTAATTLLCILTLAGALCGQESPAGSGRGPGEGQLQAVRAATKKLAEAPSYSWKSSTRSEGGGGPFGGGGSATANGQIEKDGYTWVSSSSNEHAE